MAVKLTEICSMLPICWARVDDRLIHGQVVVAWRQHLRYDQIYVVDDKVRADPFLQDVLHMAAPTGVAVRVHSVKEAVSALTAQFAPTSDTVSASDVASTSNEHRPHVPCGPPPVGAARDAGPCAPALVTQAEEASSGSSGVPPSHRILLLMKSPQTALALVEQGVSLPHLNVGSISAAPGSKRVFKTISLTREHVAALDALAERGVRITFQLTPDDAQAHWQAVRRRNPEL